MQTYFCWQFQCRVPSAKGLTCQIYIGIFLLHSLVTALKSCCKGCIYVGGNGGLWHALDVYLRIQILPDGSKNSFTSNYMVLLEVPLCYQSLQSLLIQKENSSESVYSRNGLGEGIQALSKLHSLCSCDDLPTSTRISAVVNGILSGGVFKSIPHVSAGMCLPIVLSDQKQ